MTSLTYQHRGGTGGSGCSTVAPSCASNGILLCCMRNACGHCTMGAVSCFQSLASCASLLVNTFSVARWRVSIGLLISLW